MPRRRSISSTAGRLSRTNPRSRMHVHDGRGDVARPSFKGLQSRALISRFFGPKQPSPVNYLPMRTSPVLIRLYAALSVLLSVTTCFGSAYDGHPKLVVVIVIDQFRGDYLERYRDRFGDAGFRILMDRGAYFPNC